MTADPSWLTKRIFTTGEAAAVCKVSQQTIIRCFDSGRLSGFRVPGSKFRRIPREELLRFMKVNGIATTFIDGDKKRILIVDDDQKILDVFREVFEKEGRFIVETASTGYDAGLLTHSFKPHLILLDYMLPDINGNVVCARLREKSEFRDIQVLIISGVVNRAEVEGLMAAGAAGFLQKPFKVADLMEKVNDILIRASEDRDDSSMTA
jgi:excisionase family DNA binding protein